MLNMRKFHRHFFSPNSHRYDSIKPADNMNAFISTFAADNFINKETPAELIFFFPKIFRRTPPEDGFYI